VLSHRDWFRVHSSTVSATLLRPPSRVVRPPSLDQVQPADHVTKFLFWRCDKRLRVSLALCCPFGLQACRDQVLTNMASEKNRHSQVNLNMCTKRIDKGDGFLRKQWSRLEAREPSVCPPIIACILLHVPSQCPLTQESLKLLNQTSADFSKIFVNLFPVS
jgi:hypothetical protein